jgi:two-component system, cell cycle response regulator
MTTDPESDAAVIMVIDDSATVRFAIRADLEEVGYEVREAVDGEAGIAACLADPPDVVLLDVEMPGLNGHEVLQRLKADETLKNIPVVFLTSHSDMEEVLRGLQGGGHDYVGKPFRSQELQARVGAALRVKKLQDQLVQRTQELFTTSRTDVLTGLYNRRHLEDQLRIGIATAVRRDEPIGVLLFDVDHFKAVNDTYGHQAGDEVLVELARRIQAELRAGDIAGRWGGEEFLVVLPNTGLAGTVETGERIRAIVEAEQFGAGEEYISVTISGGGASDIDVDEEALVHRADNGLYEAKDRGRNCVVVTATAGPPVVTGPWTE